MEAFSHQKRIWRYIIFFSFIGSDSYQPSVYVTLIGGIYDNQDHHLVVKLFFFFFLVQKNAHEFCPLKQSISQHTFNT